VDAGRGQVQVNLPAIGGIAPADDEAAPLEEVREAAGARDMEVHLLGEIADGKIGFPEQDLQRPRLRSRDAVVAQRPARVLLDVLEDPLQRLRRLAQTGAPPCVRGAGPAAGG